LDGNKILWSQRNDIEVGGISFGEMKLVRKYFTAAILVVGCTFSGLSQTGREFWFVAPEVSEDHGDLPILVRLSSLDQPAVVNLSLPANPFFQPIVLQMAPNSTQSIDLTSQFNSIENRPADQVLDKGILIKSSGTISAYYEVSNDVNPEIFPMKGSNALGTDFFIPGQNLFRNEEGFAAIDIVATEDNTQVTITPSNAVVGHPAGAPYTISLNKGQTYSAVAIGTGPTQKLGGSRVQSSKPIAVTYSDDSIRNGNAWDLVGDQLVPVEIVGTDYIAVRGLASEESVFIMGTQNDTEVFVGGNSNPFGTVSAGTILRVALTGPSLYIRASKPVYAYQLTGHGGEIGDALLPQITCTGSPQIGFVRPSNNVFALMLLTQKGNENHFRLNGAPFNPTGIFRTVPGTGGEWVASLNPVSINEVAQGPHLIDNTEGFFHLGILYMIGPHIHTYLLSTHTFIF